MGNRQFKKRQNFQCLFQSKSAKISRRQNNPIYGISSVPIHEIQYAYMFDNNELNYNKELTGVLIHDYANKYIFVLILDFYTFLLKFGCALISTYTVFKNKPLKYFTLSCFVVSNLVRKFYE